MAEAEVLHVRGQRLAERAARVSPEDFVVWDIGLGAAANAIAAIETLRTVNARVALHSFERDLGAAEFAIENADALGYVAPHRDTLQALLRDRVVDLGNIQWRLHLGDFSQLNITASADSPHAMLYDPYSPKANPRLWSLAHFRRLHGRLNPGKPCTLSSYSRSSAVRVTLLLSGFYVGVGPASGDKDQTTIAATHPDFIDTPLDARWLGRVQRSTKGAPLQEGIPGGPISEADWKALLAHPQFRGVRSA